MQVTRRSFVGTVGAVAGAIGMPLPPDTGSQRAYGSGHFGHWIEDGLAARRSGNTCDQIQDAKAVTKTGPGILAPNDHVHQVGNDRIVAIASNFGHLQVRQNEGAPKFLNAHAPDRRQYAGGFGYLLSGSEL